MKVKQKGKVYSSLSSPSSSTSSHKDPHSVLQLLPVAILARASALPLQDREVLAYMIMRSIITTATTNPSTVHKNKCKKRVNNKGNVQKLHLFECGCFDCYTSFWYRWDSSPNRELIHQVIEAFEDHLVQNDSPKKYGRGKEREKVVGVHESAISVRVSVKQPEVLRPESAVMPEIEGEENGCVGSCEDEEEMEDKNVNGNLEMGVMTVQAQGINHKGLARKVLPDVLGLLDSRLWSLWNPGI